jgi:hypothetical protein
MCDFQQAFTAVLHIYRDFSSLSVLRRRIGVDEPMPVRAPKLNEEPAPGSGMQRRSGQRS